MKQTTRLHDFFHPVVKRAIAPCEATPIASQSLLIAGWKKSMRVNVDDPKSFWRAENALLARFQHHPDNVPG